MEYIRHIIVVIFLGLISSCYNNNELVTPRNDITYNEHVKKIIEVKCNNCHTIDGTEDVRTPFFSSFNKVKSEVFNIQNRALNLMDMPTSNSLNGPLTQGEKDTLQLWINQGAIE